MQTGKPSHQNSRPSDGERAAVGGFRDQYQLQAEILYEHLAAGDLESIFIADRNAGRLDDFRFDTDSCRHAYQIKSGRFAGTLTFKAFTQSSSMTPSPICQLSDGWLRLRAEANGRRVIVHWVSHDIPSTSDHLGSGTNGANDSFAAFIAEAWQPQHEGRETHPEIATKWKDTWNILRETSGLNAEQFNEFVGDCVLDLGRRLREKRHNMSIRWSNEAEDIETIRHQLFELTSDPSNVIQCTCSELLDRLGWTHRLQMHSVHSFPVNSFYQPIQSTADILIEQVQTFENGYLCLQGSPGSGKSNLLTETLRYLQGVRSVFYYAYVPNGHGKVGGNSRGESESFLHDTLLALRKRHVINFVPAKERIVQLQQFHDAIHAIGEEYSRSGTKTVLVVDGLDHIDRELNPERALAADLPHPGDLPPGLIIVLGTQTLSLIGIPIAIVEQLEKPGRTIEIGRLSPEAVGQVIASYGLDTIEIANQEELLAQSGGHPLMLHYLCKRTLDTGNIDDAVAEANSTADPDTYHRRAVDRIRNKNSEAFRLLGLLSRLRGSININWVLTWAEENAAAVLLSEARHLFHIDSFGRWTFYHNSFRLFAEAETAKNILRKPDEVREQQFHQELAGYCENTTDAEVMTWEQAWHRYQARQYEACLALCTRERLLEHAVRHRPFGHIREDIRLGLLSSCHLQSSLDALRMVFLLFEFGNRAEEHHEDPTELLLTCGRVDKAVLHLWNEEAFEFNRHGALFSAKLLLDAGYYEEAEKLFDIGEPREFLNGQESVDRVFHGSAIELWAKLAPHFRPIQAILRCIKVIRFDDHVNKTDNDPWQLLRHIGMALASEKRWDVVRLVVDAFDNSSPEAGEHRFNLLVDLANAAKRVNDSQQIAIFLDIMRRDATTIEVDQSTAIRYATIELCIGGNDGPALALLAEAEEPQLIEHPHLAKTGHYSECLTLNRLRAAVGASVELHKAVPFPHKDAPSEWVINLQRQVVVIGRLWGRGWRGDLLAPYEVPNATLGIRRAIQSDRPGAGHRNIDDGLKKGFLKWLVQAIATHGTPVLEKLAEILQEDWKAKQYRPWSVDTWRSTILLLYKSGLSREYCVSLLTDLDEVQQQYESKGWWQDAIEQGRVWQALGVPEKASFWLDKHKTPDLALLSDKDDQLEHLMAWLPLCKSMPKDEVLRWSWRYAQLLASTKNRRRFAAANHVVRAAYGVSPSTAKAISRWLYDSESLRYDEHICGLFELLAADPATPTSFLLRYTLAVLPVACVEPAETCLSTLFMRLKADLMPNEYRQFLCEYVDAIEIEVVEALRNEWFIPVAEDFANSGVTVQIRETEDNDQSKSTYDRDPPTWESADGEVLNEEQLRFKLSENRTLLLNLRKPERGAYGGFPWPELVSVWLSNATLQETRHFANCAMGDRESWQGSLTALATRLKELGDDASAFEIAAADLEECCSWGVPRSSAKSSLSLMEGIDLKKAREFRFNLFAEAGSRTSASFSCNPDRSLEFLGRSVDADEIQTVVGDYLNAMFDSMVGCKSAKSLPISADADGSSIELGFQILCDQLVHPAGAIAAAAERCLTALLLVDDTLEQLITARIEQDTENAIHEATTIALLGSVASAQLVGMEPSVALFGAIEALTNHRNYALRMLAFDILTRAGKQPCQVPANLSLPAVLELDISSLSTHFELEQSDDIDSLDEDKRAMRYWKAELEVLCKATMIPLGNIEERLRQNMRRVLAIENWTKDASIQLSTHFRFYGPAYTHLRPGALASHHGLMHLFSELRDAQKIFDEHLEFINRSWRRDPNRIHMRPMRRPSGLPGMVKVDDFGVSEEEWIDSLSEDTCYHFIPIDVEPGWSILAYREYFSVGFHNTMRELREFYAGRAAEINELSTAELVELLLEGDTSTYYDCLGSQGSLLARPYPEWRQSEESLWLAVHPDMARYLNWAPQRGVECFAWRNSNDGKLCAKSIWWRSGQVNNMNLDYSHVTAEGWAVMVSHTARAEIEAAIGPLANHFSVERSSGLGTQFKPKHASIVVT